MLWFFWLQFSYHWPCSSVGERWPNWSDSALSLWLAYESVLGIMQLLGIAVSHNSMCPMTGGFANSGPYGGFLAVCIAVGLRRVEMA